MSRVYDRLESATLLLARAGAIKDRLNGAWRQCLANPEAVVIGLRRQEALYAVGDGIAG